MAASSHTNGHVRVPHGELKRSLRKADGRSCVNNSTNPQGTCLSGIGSGTLKTTGGARNLYSNDLAAGRGCQSWSAYETLCGLYYAGSGTAVCWKCAPHKENGRLAFRLIQKLHSGRAFPWARHISSKPCSMYASHQHYGHRLQRALVKDVGDIESEFSSIGSQSP